MSDEWEIISRRRMAHQGLSAPLGSVGEVVAAARAMCGAHAQVQAAAEHSVARRLHGVTRADVQAALWERRELVRTYGPRGTVHLLPSADLHLWPGALTALDGGTPRHADGVRLDDGQVDLVVAAVADALAGAELTLTELDDAVGLRLGGWAVEATMPAFGTFWPRWRQAITVAAHRGALCFARPRGRAVTYTSPSSWLPGFEPAPAEVAVPWLMSSYRAAYGPSEPRHLARWLATTETWARAAWGSASSVEHETAADAVEVHGLPAIPDVMLLPYFDAYVVAAQPRERMFPGRAWERALAGSQAGNFPVLLVRGVARETVRRQTDRAGRAVAAAHRGAAVRSGGRGGADGRDRAGSRRADDRRHHGGTTRMNEGAAMTGPAAQVREITVEGGWPALELVTAGARVQLIPELGCDIVSFVDARTGVDVLWRVPWGIPPRSTGPFSAATETEWGERFPGGWNVLLPNAGAATPAPGGTTDHTWGFHGEAALLPWTVLGSGADDDRAWAELEVRLIRAPLRLHRRLELVGSSLAITETLTNLSPVPIEVMWSQHPSFGAPLVAAGTRIETGARVTETDDTLVDGDLAAGERSVWPHAPAQDGSAVDLSVVPDLQTHRLVYLSDFDTGWARLVNDEIGLAARLEWDTSVYPSAWLWQELNDTPGHPWWKLAYVCAIEPGTTYPGQGLEVAKAKGGTPLLLAGGEQRTVTVGLSTETP